MEVKEFIEVLENNLSKELLFEHSNGKFVGANYHLTEVKNVFFDTVDCGGKSNHWNETHFQLWESPKEIGKTNYMTVDKIVGILKRVDAIKPIDVNTTVKIEYGNSDFHTSVMDIDQIESFGNKIVVKLFTEATSCKAIISDETSVDSSLEKGACLEGVGCC